MWKLLTISFVLLTTFNSVVAQNNDTISKVSRHSYYGPDSNNVYTFVEQNPEFQGGDKELIKFIQQHLRYPPTELAKGIEGKVLLRFVIETDGSVSNVKVTGSKNTALNNEAIRIVKSLPRFIPGRWSGKPVRVYFNLPIVFKLP